MYVNDFVAKHKSETDSKRCKFSAKFWFDCYNNWLSVALDVTKMKDCTEEPIPVSDIEEAFSKCYTLYSEQLSISFNPTWSLSSKTAWSTYLYVL